MADVKLVLLVLAILLLDLATSRGHLQMELDTQHAWRQQEQWPSLPAEDFVRDLLQQSREATERAGESRRVSDTGLLLAILQHVQPGAGTSLTPGREVTRGKRQRTCYWNVITCF